MRLLVVIFIGITLLSFAQLPDGKKLFTGQCAPCHGIDKQYTGPPFQHIRDYYTEEQLLAFIHNAPKFIQNDKRMQVVRGLNYCGVMVSFPFMKPAELKAILDYVDSFPYEPNSPLYAHRKFTTAQQDSAINLCNQRLRKP